MSDKKTERKRHNLIAAAANPYGIVFECTACGKTFTSSAHVIGSDECKPKQENTMNKDKELKACPFCGSEVYLYNGPVVDGCFCQNEKCVLFGRMFDIPQWNTRHPDPMLAKAVDALKGMVESYNKVWINHKWFTGDYDLLPSEVAKAIVAAEEAIQEIEGAK